MSYIEGFVVPVPREKKQAYRAMVEKVQGFYKENGALRIVETWGDDVPDGKVTDFRRAIQAEPDENVVFSFIVWPSKLVRDNAHEKMKTDPRMQPGDDVPFNMQRMIYGGFVPLFDSAGELSASS